MAVQLSEKKDFTEDIVVRELPYLFEKELTMKQNRHNHLVEKYVPNVFCVTPISLKFYSKYDNIVNPVLAHLGIVDTSMKPPNQRFREPLLESHNYGWHQNGQLKNMVQEFHCLSYRKIRSDITIFGEKLACSRITERPKFTGIRFYLR